VQVDPKRLAAAGVTLNQSSPPPATRCGSPADLHRGVHPRHRRVHRNPRQRLTIQHVLPITTAEDLAQVPVEDVAGVPLRLGDVADVVEDHQPSSVTPWSMTVRA